MSELLGSTSLPNVPSAEADDARRGPALPSYPEDSSTCCAGVLGVVLAGTPGRGSAVDALLRGPLLSVAQQPLLSYPVRWLAAAGVRRITLCAGEETGAVRARFAAGHTLDVALSYYEDRTPRGPAGCARDAALASDAERFVVVEGALVPTLDLHALLAAHRASGAAATTVVETDRRRSPMRQTSPTMPGGVYVFERRVLETVPATGFQDIKQGLLERLYARGEPVAIHTVDGLSPHVLDFTSYAAVSSWLITSAARAGSESSAHAADAPFAGWCQLGDARRHPSAQLHPTAQLIGPVLLGPDVRVDAHAVILGPTSIGAGSLIERDAIVSRSELWERCVVGAGAHVDGALLADRAVAAPSTVVRGAVVVGPAATDAPNAIPEQRPPVSSPIRLTPNLAMPSLHLPQA